MHSLHDKFSRNLTVVIIFVLISFFNFEAKAQGVKAKADTLSKTVLIYPVIKTGENEVLLTIGHKYKDHLNLGDQLAHDYLVAVDNDDGNLIVHRNDGKENKDYTGWKKNVMAPVTGMVVLVNDPKKTNKPGIMNRGAEPGRIYIKNDEGITVSLVHVREVKVQKGQKVEAGDVVAKVGNNGNSTLPHIHVGAWKNGSPYQPVIDLYAEQRYDG